MAATGVFIWSLSTSSCVAAIRLAEMGIDVYVCGAWPHIGEMAATGLGQTDREIINSTRNYWGYQNEFFLRAGDLCGFNTDPTKARRRQIFPSMQAAEQILLEWLNKYPERTTDNVGNPKGKIVWRTNAPLENVKMVGNAITEVTAGGVTYVCTNYLDGSDENDLAKMAGMPMRLGREGRYLTGEIAAGMQLPQLAAGTQAYDPVTGNRKPWVKPRPRQTGVGQGDSSIMAFNTRTIITDDPNRIQFADMVVPGFKFENYDKELYLASVKNFQTIPGAFDDILQPVYTYNTYDMNSAGLSYGNNSQGDMFDWHNSTFPERKKMWEDYVCRKAGLFKAICSDPRWAAALPNMVADTKRYGMVPGLWTDSIVQGWPPMMYVRESFRLKGQYTLTEKEVFAPAPVVKEPICTYAYHMDRHPAGVWASAKGFFAMEGGSGNFGEAGDAIGLQMPWGCLKPPLGRCKNLQVLRGISGTCLGRVKMRIEISQMKIADSAAIIAGTAERIGVSSNELDYATQVKPALLAAGAILEVT